MLEVRTELLPAADLERYTVHGSRMLMARALA